MGAPFDSGSKYFIFGNPIFFAAFESKLKFFSFRNDCYVFNPILFELKP
jgi:hypothetical protein